MRPEQHYARARAAEDAGDLSLARQLYLALQQLAPDYPNLSFRLGLLASQRGELVEAESFFQAELARQPDFWACRVQLALSLMARRQFQPARLALQQALADCPTSARAEQARIWHLIGRCRRAEADLPQALQAFEQAHQLQPHPDHLREQARVYQAQGHFELARHYFDQTWVQSQQASDLWALADQQLLAHDYAKAAGTFRQLARLPALTLARQALALGQVAVCQQALNQPEAALCAYAEASALQPLAALDLSRPGVLPMVYSSQAQVLQWRERSVQALQWLEAQPAAPENLLDWQAPPFYLAYQGYNDRDWLARFSAQVRRRLPPLQTGLPNLPRRPVLRLGLISRFFHHHSVMRCFARLFMALVPRGPFTLHLIAASSLLQDQLTADLRRSATSWTWLQGDLLAQAAQIQALELDLLIYTDTLLDAQTYLLSHYRLAPRQLLLPGQPVTSGVSTLDLFVSDQLSEPPEAQAHYTEQLIQLPHWPTLYARPALSSPLSPAALGLPAGRVYLCAASVFKLHPQMDAVFVGILQQDPQAQLLLLELSAEGLTVQVRARLADQLTPAQLARLHLWPKQPPARFSALLQGVDVLLETFPFGSLNTLMVALAAGTPMVTWPGDFVRGRYARTLLLRMECPELIAGSAEDYVRIAVEVARDDAWRQRIRQRFAAHSHRLFDNPVALPEVRDLLLEAAGWS
ncbi:MAG: hypothetical protein IGS03_12845 [Candidatus Sericytochromatia bacterium]|nr:hypothetical protein [Candidatus Sericytochromatia bacterium]